MVYLNFTAKMFPRPLSTDVRVTIPGDDWWSQRRGGQTVDCRVELRGVSGRWYSLQDGRSSVKVNLEKFH